MSLRTRARRVCDGEDDSDSIRSFSETSGLSVIKDTIFLSVKRAAVAHLKSWQLAVLAYTRTHNGATYLINSQKSVPVDTPMPKPC